MDDENFEIGGRERPAWMLGPGLTYVATSWSYPDTLYCAALDALRAAGLPYYDFRGLGGDGGFAWSLIDPDWRSWSPADYLQAIETPIAHAAFERDRQALTACENLLLLLPCGRSAHLEAGHAIALGKKVVIVLAEETPPSFDLMYAFENVTMVTDLDDAIRVLKS